MVGTRVFELTRVTTGGEAGARTLFFQTPGLGRRSRPLFFRPPYVPAFEGDAAWFECERRKGAWRILRRVAPDGTPFVATTEPIHD